jgi:hypothetical protein
MPESQDDEDSGYFPLVMTRKTKNQLVAATAIDPPVGNGVYGS